MRAPAFLLRLSTKVRTTSINLFENIFFVVRKFALQSIIFTIAKLFCPENFSWLHKDFVSISRGLGDITFSGREASQAIRKNNQHIAICSACKKQSLKEFPFFGKAPDRNGKLGDLNISARPLWLLTNRKDFLYIPTGRSANRNEER